MGRFTAWPGTVRGGPETPAPVSRSMEKRVDTAALWAVRLWVAFPLELRNDPGARLNNPTKHGKREDVMKTGSLAILAFFAAATVPALADQATFIKKPKGLAGKMSTVTTYRGDGGGGGGSVINCSGACFSDGGTRYWQCKGTHADVACFLSCSPPPPRGECHPF
jgi:hypothetical protein